MLDNLSFYPFPYNDLNNAITPIQSITSMFYEGLILTNGKQYFHSHSCESINYMCCWYPEHKMQHLSLTVMTKDTWRS